MFKNRAMDLHAKKLTYLGFPVYLFLPSYAFYAFSFLPLVGSSVDTAQEAATINIQTQSELLQCKPSSCPAFKH
jgi:hypothetical protein